MAKTYMLLLTFLVLTQVLLINGELYTCEKDIFNGSLASCNPMLSCETTCENGRCSVLTGKCECNKGSHPRWDSSCETDCPTGCPRNSECVDVNECKCNDGYEMKDNFCFPVCAGDWGLNSYCAVPGSLRCLPGHEQKDGKCEPICEPVCNGTNICLAPNVCGLVSEMGSGPCYLMHDTTYHMIAIYVLATISAVMMAVIILSWSIHSKR